MFAVLSVDTGELWCDSVSSGVSVDQCTRLRRVPSDGDAIMNTRTGLTRRQFVTQAAAAAVAAIQMIDREKLLAKAAELGRYIMTRLAQMKEKFDCICQIRGRGLMVGIELDIPGADLVNACLEKGLRINCTHETVLRFMPALTATKEQIDQALDILEDVLAKHASASRSAADSASPSGVEQ